MIKKLDSSVASTFSIQSDRPSIVIRLLATSIPKTIWLICRKVIFSKRGAMFVKVLKSLSWASRSKLGLLGFNFTRLTPLPLLN